VLKGSIKTVQLEPLDFRWRARVYWVNASRSRGMCRT
jgi:hypothetical protein